MARKSITLASASLLAAMSLPDSASAQYNGCPPPTPPSLDAPPGGGRAPGGPGYAGPTTGGPGSPGSPGAGGPSSPGSSGPSSPTPSTGGGTPGPGGPTTGGGGSPIVFERGDSSKQLLEIEWDFAVPEDIHAQPMSFRRAFEEIRGDDPRPLLILRECDSCKGSSRALLDAGQNDEKTRLLTRWFHCVKLPNHVWEPTHPYYELFEKAGWVHMFVASWDGKKQIPFSGVQPRAKLWRAMRGVLDSEYVGKSDAALKRLAKQLDTYDRLDSLVKDALVQADRALETHGPKSPKYRKAKTRLDRDRARLASAKETERKLIERSLRRKSIETSATKSGM